MVGRPRPRRPHRRGDEDVVNDPAGPYLLAVGAVVFGVVLLKLGRRWWR